jgi:hypothetical protein
MRFVFKGYIVVLIYCYLNKIVKNALQFSKKILEDNKIFHDRITV